jgi:hypothetical protein
MTEEEFAAHFKLGQFSEAQNKEVAEGRMTEQRQSFADIAPLELPDYGTLAKVSGTRDCLLLSHSLIIVA